MGGQSQIWNQSQGDLCPGWHGRRLWTWLSECLWLWRWYSGVSRSLLSVWRGWVSSFIWQSNLRWTCYSQVRLIIQKKNILDKSILYSDLRAKEHLAQQSLRLWLRQQSLTVMLWRVSLLPMNFVPMAHAAVERSAVLCPLENIPSWSSPPTTHMTLAETNPAHGPFKPQRVGWLLWTSMTCRWDKTPAPSATMTMSWFLTHTTVPTVFLNHQEQNSVASFFLTTLHLVFSHLQETRWSWTTQLTLQTSTEDEDSLLWPLPSTHCAQPWVTSTDMMTTHVMPPAVLTLTQQAHQSQCATLLQWQSSLLRQTQPFQSRVLL